MHCLPGFYTSESQAAVHRSVDKNQVLKDDVLRNEPSQDGAQEGEKCETEDHSLDKKPSVQRLKELYVLLCCKDSIRIHPAKSVVQVSLLFLILIFLDFVFY